MQVCHLLLPHRTVRVQLMPRTPDEKTTAAGVSGTHGTARYAKGCLYIVLFPPCHTPRVAEIQFESNQTGPLCDVHEADPTSLFGVLASLKSRTLSRSASSHSTDPPHHPQTSKYTGSKQGLG